MSANEDFNPAVGLKAAESILVLLTLTLCGTSRIRPLILSKLFINQQGRQV